MKMNRLLLTLIASFFLSSCKVKIPNITACAHFKNKVFCKQTLLDDEATYEVHSCQKFVDGRISMSIEDWAELKKFILKVCKKSKKCRKEAPDLNTKIQELEDVARGV